MSEIHCKSCDALVPAASKFCTGCGGKMEAVDESPVADEALFDYVAAGPEHEPSAPPAPPAVPNASVRGGTGAGASASASGPHHAPIPPLSGMVQYDPGVIQSFADGLYRAADRIVMMTAIIGALIGGAIGLAFGQAVGGGALIGLLGAAVGGFIGHSRGISKTFQLRLQAQLALCQVEIEFNTRSLRQ